MSHQYVAGKTGLKSCSLLLSVALVTLAGQFAVAGGKHESSQQLPANINLPQEILFPEELPMNNPKATLSVDPYGGLYTVGNQIVDQTGGYCRMTGVNFSGFETSLGVPAGTWQRDYSDMIDDIVRAGFNTIRLPFSVDNMTSTSPATPAYLYGEYEETKLNSTVRANNDLVQQWNAVGALPLMKTPLECLDAFVKYAGSKGLKIILDCHSQKSDDYGNQYLWYVPGDTNHSEDTWINTWVMLAQHYNNSDNDPYYAVIACDLFNEPKGNPTSTTAPGCAWTVVDGTQAWNHAAERCAVEILTAAPRMLILIEGVQWANSSATTNFGSCDYTNWGENLKAADVAPIDLGTTEFNQKVVYSFHEYPASASYISGLTTNDMPENPLPWFPMSRNYGQCSTTDYPNNLEAVWQSQWGYIAEANTRPLYAGEFGSWLDGDLYGQVSCAGPYGDIFCYQDYAAYLQTMIDAGTAPETTPQAIIDSDNQWMVALLDYMDSAPATTDVSKLGISFTYFCWNPNSNDTGGLVSGDDWTLPSSASAYSQQLQLIKPYLAPLITTSAGSSYGGGIQGERVLESPRTSLLVRGNSLSQSALMGGKVEFALTRLAMKGTFAWKDSSIVPPEGSSIQFVRFTPANTAFRSVLLPVRVSVAPTPTQIDGLGVELPGKSTASQFGPFYGVNLCGAEYSPGTLPGSNGVNYAFPTEAQTSYYVGKGMNIIRLPFLWERLQPTMSGAFDSGYQTLLVNSVAALRATGATVLIDVHNYNMRNVGDQYLTAGIGTSRVPVSAFTDLWTKLATLFKGDQGVVFGLMNEPTGGSDNYGVEMTTAQWVANANAAITAIRATGAQNWLTCPGNFYTGAWSWSTRTDYNGSPSTTNAVAMLNVTDSLNKTVIEVHQYFDNEYQGTTQSCLSSDGETLLSDVTSWARTNGKQLFLGEFGSGNNSTCESAVASSTEGVLQYMQSNSDVWAGWTWWSSVADNTANGQGAFGATDFSLAPANGVDSAYMGWLTPYITDAFTADLDRDGRVDVADMGAILMNFGKCASPRCVGDLNSDGQVDNADLGILLGELHD